MLARYASTSGLMYLKCLMLTLSGHVELLFLLCFIASWTCVVASVIVVVCFPIFVPVCFVCFMLVSVGELFVECVYAISVGMVIVLSLIVIV